MENKKNRPVQMVQLRGEQDMFWKEGLGGDELPDWASQETVKAHVEKMSGAFDCMERLFDERGDDTLPLLMVAVLDEKAIGRKAYRANVRAVFDTSRKRNVLGKESSRGLLVKVDNKTDLLNMRRVVVNAGRAEASKAKICGVGVIDDLRLFHPTIEDVIDGGNLKVRLVDYHDKYLNDLSDKMMLHYGSQNGLDVRKLEYAQGLRLYAVNGATAATLQSLATMDSVISVKKMPYIELSVSPELHNTELKVQSPKVDETYPRVGILDSGVEPIPHLGPWLEGKEQNQADLAEEDIRRRHGTSVAGIINYGDELQGQKWTGTIPSLITSCIVNTECNVAHISEDEMVEHIKTAVKDNPEVKVWNLSQGSNVEISDDEFSDFGIALDNIQKEYHVLICKSAGNVHYLTPDHARITQGADSVMSLVVGSVAHEKVSKDDVDAGERSPFSRIGPAPAGVIKPDLVHYGGNSVTGVYSFSEVGYQTNTFKGTSHSTPRVTALAANLSYRLGGEFNPLLIRALLIHSANYVKLDDTVNDVLSKELGFGKPEKLDDILYNDDDEFTMVLQPEFKDRDYQIQDIPFPQELVSEDGFYEGEVTITVVSDPILRGGEHGEYCQSDVEVLLQTYDGTDYVVPGAAGVPRQYRNANRLVGQENVLAKGCYGRRSFKTANYAERTVLFGGKYQPVKKYHVNLGQMTRSHKEVCLKSNRRWGVSIKATFRDATRADMDAGINVGNMKAVIILTIRDPKKRSVVYDKCMGLLAAHNFAHNDIMVRQHIEVV